MQPVGTNTVNERLKWARKQAGFESAAECARRYGWAVPTYSSHENGNRGIPKNKVIEYSKRLKINPLWLMTGEGTPKEKNNKQPLLGYIGAGAEVIPIDDFPIGAGIDEVDAPPETEKDTCAVQIKGDSMWPALRDGDVIYYESRQYPPSECVGRECAVKLEDGRLFIKQVESAGQNSSYILTSYNAPSLTNVKILWCAPVLWVKRR